MRTILLCCLALMILGCRTNEKSVLPEVGAHQADPQNVPRDRTLYNLVPVVALKFEASETGYTMKAFRATGAPSSTIDQNRDVVIKASDGQGRLLASVSIFNPRDIRTVGAKQPAQAVRPKGTFTVFFAKPDEITVIEVKVVRGTNSGFTQRFTVNPKELPPLEDARKDEKTDKGGNNDNKKP
jgi:hypothetical protein